MSVHSEFQRILRDLTGFLERTGGPGCEDWARRLDGAAAIGRENVSAGARQALELLQEGAAPELASPLEIEEFARLQEHLTSLCHVILGR
jgi:hypothetical protein